MEWWAVVLTANVIVSIVLVAVALRNGRSLRRLRHDDAPLDPEELRRRRRAALDIHDDIVQGLAMAKLSLELGATEEAMATLDAALAAARVLVTDVLGETGVVDLRQGALRRSTPAGR